MFDLVMFDLDGTLVDTATDIANTANDVLESIGFDPIPHALLRNWIGNGSRELMVRAYAHASGASIDAVRRCAGGDSLMEVFSRFHEQRCGQHSQVFPQVRETLTALLELGVGLAVLTNKETRFARLVLERHGLQDFFDPVIAGDTLSARKPDPLPVLHCLREHGVEPKRALLVGDSTIDIMTGRNVGVACWVVPYGYNGGVPIGDCEPDRLIDDFSVIARAIQDGDAPLTNHPIRHEESPSWP